MSEAARYRVRLREAESELAAATERIQRYQRSEVERLAGQQLADAGDLWRVGEVELSELLDADGNVSQDAVSAITERVLESSPGLRRPQRAVDPTQGRSMDVKSEPSWSALLNR